MSGKGKAHLTLEDHDRGWNKIQTELRKAQGGAFAKIGWLGDPEHEAREDGGPLGNVAIAIIQEFGSSRAHIPERSSLRASFDKNRGSYEKLLARLAKGLYGGVLTMEEVVSVLGLTAANDVKAFIREGVPPPNSPAVQAAKRALGHAKGAVKTLIDTGRMLASIDFEPVIFGYRVIGKHKKEQGPSGSPQARLESRQAKEIARSQNPVERFATKERKDRLQRLKRGR